MPKFCVYCGNPVKESDKFCIGCGKPLLTDLPKEKTNKKETKKQKKEKPAEEKLEEKELEEEEEEEELKDKKKDKKKSKKEKKVKEIKPLPEDVKEQLNLYIKMEEIKLNKKLLAEKLKEVLKATKNPEYDLDIDFKDKTNVKLEAIKKLIEELKQKENEIKVQVEEPFIVQVLDNKTNSKIFQLKNLTREFRLHKMNKETFDKLKEKYKKEKKEFDVEREDLISGMKLWIQELKEERMLLSGERKLNKGRLSAKEISEEEFNEKDKEFDKKIKKMDSKIKTLQALSK
ncbi:MAG: zinc ribbon domain-containing protein [Promethearchaeota archaeon]